MFLYLYILDNDRVEGLRDKETNPRRLHDGCEGLRRLCLRTCTPTPPTPYNKTADLRNQRPEKAIATANCQPSMPNPIGNLTRGVRIQRGPGKSHYQNGHGGTRGGKEHHPTTHAHPHGETTRAKSLPAEPPSKPWNA